MMPEDVADAFYGLWTRAGQMTGPQLARLVSVWVASDRDAVQEAFRVADGVDSGTLLSAARVRAEAAVEDLESRHRDTSQPVGWDIVSDALHAAGVAALLRKRRKRLPSSHYRWLAGAWEQTIGPIWSCDRPLKRSLAWDLQQPATLQALDELLDVGPSEWPHIRALRTEIETEGLAWVLRENVGPDRLLGVLFPGQLPPAAWWRTHLGLAVGWYANRCTSSQTVPRSYACEVLARPDHVVCRMAQAGKFGVEAARDPSRIGLWFVLQSLVPDDGQFGL